jgi:hypothetical protein
MRRPSRDRCDRCSVTGLDVPLHQPARLTAIVARRQNQQPASEMQIAWPDGVGDQMQVIYTHALVIEMAPAIEPSASSR